MVRDTVGFLHIYDPMPIICFALAVTLLVLEILIITTEKRGIRGYFRAMFKIVSNMQD